MQQRRLAQMRSMTPSVGCFVYQECDVKVAVRKWLPLLLVTVLCRGLNQFL